MEDRRIFLAGQEFSLYLSRLYDKIGERTNEFSFFSEWHPAMSKSRIFVDSKTINKVDVTNLFSKYRKLTSLFRILSIAGFYIEIYRAVKMKQVKGLRSLYSYITSFHILPFIIRENVIKKQKFTSFHFHYLHPNNLRLLDYLPDESHIICTFWGSDIFLQDSEWENYYVAKALKHASIITVTTREMAQAVIDKYGANLKEKIQFCTFVLDEVLFTLIEDIRIDVDFKRAFRDKFKIPQEKTLISIGNNGRLANNHMQVIETLCGLEKTMKENLFMIVPLTYAIEQPNYVETISNALTEGGFQFMILDSFLSLEELAGFRMITDIYIHVPGDDALSGTAIEYMYAGNILVTGGWLPYSFFKEIGLNYFVVDRIQCLSEVINAILLQMEEQKNITKDNTARIKKALHPDRVVDGWIDCYRLLGEKQL